MFTVKELIEELKKFDENLPIEVRNLDGYWDYLRSIKINRTTKSIEPGYFEVLRLDE